MIDQSQLQSLPRASVVIAASAVAVSCPADTTEDVLAVIPVLAGVLGLNGRLRITTTWSASGVSAKTYRVRYSGAAGTQYANLQLNGSTTALKCVTEIANRAAPNSQHGTHVFHSTDSTNGIGLVNAATSAVDTTAATSIVLTGQKVTGADTLTLESYLVELFPS